MNGPADLLTLSDESFRRTRARLEGLTDAELMWEPAVGCWSVRRGPDGQPAADWSPMPDRPPLTTIAWRIWHLCEVYGAARNEQWLRGTDDGGAGARVVPALTAAEALAALDLAHGWWRTVLTSLTEADLGEPLGPQAGPYAEADKAAFVLHQLDEAIHHGAELGVLRDLYANTVNALPTDPALEALYQGRAPADMGQLAVDLPGLLPWAAANGHWQVVTTLVEHGSDVNAARNGATALHHAAAAGRLDLAQLLVDAGADRSVVDDQFHATPLGWAQHFGRTELEALLAER